MSQDGIANLAPFSFFNAGGANPPSVVFMPVTSGTGRDKDTLHNVRATGEYVDPHRPLRAARADERRPRPDYPPEVDEFVEAGFTKAPSARVKPWRAVECPIAMECRLFQIVEHGAGPYHANYVIGAGRLPPHRRGGVHRQPRRRGEAGSRSRGWADRSARA